MMIYAVSAGAAGLMNAVAGKPIPIGYAHVIGLMGILSGVLFVQAVLSPRNS